MYTLANINVGVYMLGEMESTIDREFICRNILNTIQLHDIDIICTQEDVFVGSSSNRRPEFQAMYESYGYTWVTLDVLDKSESNTLIKKHAGREVNIGNVIYIRKKHSSKVRPLLAKPYPSPACLTQIQFDDILIANVHLCGGRFDDIKVFEKTDFFLSKLESVSDLNHSIICGDFNATRSIGKAGGLKNYNYPLELYKNSEGAPDIDMVLKWNIWQCKPVEFFYDHHYVSCFTDEELETLQETTRRGNYVVDWIFYNTSQVNKIMSHCVKMYGHKNALSDHHMLTFTFTPKNEEVSCSKSIYV